MNPNWLGHPLAMACATDMIDGCRKYFEQKVNKPVADALAVFDGPTQQLLKDMGSEFHGGYAGRVGNETKEQLQQIGQILQGNGNIRELVEL